MTQQPDDREAKDCPDCKGDGLVAWRGGAYECPACRGLGWVRVDVVDDEKVP